MLVHGQIIGKLCAAIGQDAFDSLYRTARDTPWSVGAVAGNFVITLIYVNIHASPPPPLPPPSRPRTSLGRMGAVCRAVTCMFVFALAGPLRWVGILHCAALLHSLLEFVQVVALNVAINSHSHALLTLLVSNNFIELKVPCRVDVV